MPVSDAYADAATYRALIRRNDNVDDTVILDDLKAVSRYLDRKLGRFFTKDAAAVARAYYGEGRLGDNGRKLYVDDIASTTGLAIKVDADADGLFSDETAWASTDYQLLPLDANRGPEPRPWTAIYVPSWSSKGAFGRRSHIEVTAEFGWPAVPLAIARATCHLTAIVRMDSPRALSGIGQDVESILDQLPDGQRIVAQLSRGYARPRVFA